MPFAMFNPCEPCCVPVEVERPCTPVNKNCYLLSSEGENYHLARVTYIDGLATPGIPPGFNSGILWRCSFRGTNDEFLQLYTSNLSGGFYAFTFVSYNPAVPEWIYRDSAGIYFNPSSDIVIRESNDVPCDDTAPPPSGDNTLCCVDSPWQFNNTLKITFTEVPINCGLIIPGLIMNLNRVAFGALGDYRDTWATDYIEYQPGYKLNFVLFCGKAFPNDNTGLKLYANCRTPSSGNFDEESLMYAELLSKNCNPLELEFRMSYKITSPNACGCVPNPDNRPVVVVTE